MEREKIIAQLVKKAGKAKFLSQEDILPFAKPGSEAYFNIERVLLDNDVDILLPEELEDEDDAPLSSAGLQIEEDDDVQNVYHTMEENTEA